ncbi:MAG: alpha/beta hydrolase [Pseudomonadota bacterium]
MDKKQRPLPPLVRFEGAPVEAPKWFQRALETPVETGFTEHEGAQIAWKAWGERGAPGIILAHGGTAHKGWWDAIGPHLAASGRRVVAPDLPGMGQSDWRETYTMAIHAADALAAAEAGGAFEAGVPHFFGHSFGGFVALTAALHHGDRLKGAALLDSPIRAPQEQRDGSPPRRGGRVYPDLTSALARFRLLPDQLCANVWLVDHIARGSLKEVEGGFTWMFDPGIWAKLTYERRDPEHAAANAKCPLAFVRGADSALCNAEIWDFMKTTFTSSAFLSVPHAQHHLILDQPLACAAVLEALAETWPA